MSYDVILLREGPEHERDWADAIESAQAGDEVPVDAAAWVRVVAAARGILGDGIDVAEGGLFFELSDEATGIQAHLSGMDAGVSVPYWYRGERAAPIVDRVYRLATAIAEATGFAGYDPQVELPLPRAVGAPDRAVSVFDQVADSFARRGIASPSADG